MATMRSHLASADGPPDLHLFAAGPFNAGQDASPAGAVFGLVTGLVLPYSRGWVRIRSATYHHPAGTCRMGPDPDGGAVVDARGRVHGIEHPHVADASIMPAIPSANTNLPTIMIAERVAPWISAERHRP
jgi:choline dehydrogenase-like flavoprotein